MYVCLCAVSPVASCSMDEWLDSPSVSQTTRIRIPLNVLFFFSLFLVFLSLLAWADIRAAELVTWGVGPDANTSVLILMATLLSERFACTLCSDTPTPLLYYDRIYMAVNILKTTCSSPYSCCFGRVFQASVCIATNGMSVPSLHTESTDSVIM